MIGDFCVVLHSLLFAYFVRPGSSLECDSVYSCTKSIYVTGECVKNVCECKPGFVPNDYGCQEIVVPTISATTYRRVSCNGDAVEGGEIELQCDAPYPVDGPYKWFLDGTEIKGEETSTYNIGYLRKSQHAGSYSCSIKLNGVESELSKEFVIKFVENAKNAAHFTKPIVTGFPKKLLDGQFLKIKCKSIPAVNGSNFSFTFNIGGEIIENGPDEDSYNLGITKGDERKISCTFRFGSVKLKSQIISLPLITDVPPEVTIQGPSNFVLSQTSVLTCSIDDDFHGLLTSWHWTRDGKPLEDETYQELELYDVKQSDEGTYTCRADFVTSNQTKMSKPFPVKTVEANLTMIPVLEQALITGYYSLECKVEGVNSSDIVYAWKFDGLELPGVFDNIIQMNDPGLENLQGFTCNPTVKGVEFVDSIPIDGMMVTELGSIQPVIERSNNCTGGGETTLTCSSVYSYALDMRFIWKRDHEVLVNQTSRQITDARTGFYDCQLDYFSTKSLTSKTFFLLLPKGQDRLCRIPGEQNCVNSFEKTYNFTCPGSPNDPNKSYVWRKNGYILYGKNSYTLTIKATERPTDITCQVKTLGPKPKPESRVKTNGAITLSASIQGAVMIIMPSLILRT